MDERYSHRVKNCISWILYFEKPYPFLIESKVLLCLKKRRKVVNKTKGMSLNCYYSSNRENKPTIFRVSV